MRKLNIYLLLVIFSYIVPWTKSLGEEDKCVLDADCGIESSDICQGGLCLHCIACDEEYNRRPGNESSASCPETTTLNCGECMPNFSSTSNNSSLNHKGEIGPIRCESGIEEAMNIGDRNLTNSLMITEDKNAPWFYISLVGSFLLIFSGVGTWLSWKFQPMILEMKRRRQRATNEYRQQSEDIKNTSIREKQKLNRDGSLNKERPGIASS